MSIILTANIVNVIRCTVIMLIIVMMCASMFNVMAPNKFCLKVSPAMTQEPLMMFSCMTKHFFLPCAIPTIDIHNVDQISTNNPQGLYNKAFTLEFNLLYCQLLSHLS